MLFWVWTKAYLYFQNDFCINSIVFHIVCIYTHIWEAFKSQPYSMMTWFQRWKYCLCLIYSTVYSLRCLQGVLATRCWWRIENRFNTSFSQRKTKTTEGVLSLQRKVGSDSQCSEMNWSWWLVSSVPLQSASEVRVFVFVSVEYADARKVV